MQTYNQALYNIGQNIKMHEYYIINTEYIYLIHIHVMYQYHFYPPKNLCQLMSQLYPHI